MMQVIGIGTDIVECLRIAQMIERHGDLFINRIYTSLEINRCRDSKQATQQFAGIWAGKEALLKVLGTGWRRGVSWRDLEIKLEDSGAAEARLHGGARELADQRGIDRIMISISHCRSHAVAYAMGLGHRQA